MDWISLLLGGLAGMVICAPAIMWLFSRQSAAAAELAAARAQLDQLARAYQDQRSTLNTCTGNLLDAEKRCAGLEAELTQAHRQADEKLTQMMKVKEEMTGQFRVLAEDVMKRHGESFTQQNKEQMEGLLNPLRHKLTDFQQELQKAHTENAKERASLTEQIKSLSETSGRMTTETLNLTRALKGETRTQGAWGEMILDTILERSGLREGYEYVTQDSHTTEDGRRQRLDVLIKYPDNKHIIVDSKVSLRDFEAYVNAETDAARQSHIKAHARCLRAHVKLLSEKAYQKLTDGGLDYVIMFVPSEGAVAAALGEDPELTGYAAGMNVAIVTPTTLMIALRTIANVWNVENRNRHAEQIADRAGKLYDKFVGFVEDMQKLGGQLDTAHATYGKAMGKLSSGPGNLVRQTETIKKMGAKATKALPPALLDDDDEESKAAAPDLLGD